MTTGISAPPIGTINKIPKIIHQIWFGNTPPSYKEHLLNSVRDICYKNNFDYKLWTNEDLNEDNFPITYKYIQMSIKAGKKNNNKSQKNMRFFVISYYYDSNKH